MSKQYCFITQWQIKAPVVKVWDAIYESERWPDWWKDVKHVEEIIKGDEKGIGSVRIYTLVSPARYKLTFNLEVTDRVEYELLQGTASGELEGTGAWRFKEVREVTFVECHWEVATNIAWMNYFAFLLGPLFRLNHSIVMRRGAKSLAKKLGAELISY